MSLTNITCIGLFLNGNKKGTLHQNYGYSGYDENVAEWENYEDAIADEDNID